MITFRILFWNIRQTAAPSLIEMVARENDADIVILAESKHELAAVVEALNVNAKSVYQIPFNIENRFQFFARLSPRRVQSVSDESYLSIKHVHPVIGVSFLLAAVHLPSKLCLDVQDQAVLCSRWIKIISEAETRVGHRRTIVIGDINMNPFEVGIVGSDGFHAISCRKVAARVTRTVLTEERCFFYNPMWSLMGDHSGVPGTYFYSSSKPISFFWNMFDQVLLRPELAKHFSVGDVVVPTEVDGLTLLPGRGIPNEAFSDHLPLIATVKLEDFDDGSQ